MLNILLIVIFINFICIVFIVCNVSSVVCVVLCAVFFYSVYFFASYVLCVVS
jgi:hypothetical protein